MGRREFEDQVPERSAPDIYAIRAAALYLLDRGPISLLNDAPHGSCPWLIPFYVQQVRISWFEVMVARIGYGSGWGLDRVRRETQRYLKDRTSDELRALLTAILVDPAWDRTGADA